MLRVFPVLRAQVSGRIDHDQEADQDDRQADQRAELVDDDAKHHQVAQENRSMVRLTFPARSQLDQNEQATQESQEGGDLAEHLHPGPSGISSVSTAPDKRDQKYWQGLNAACFVPPHLHVSQVEDKG